MIPIITKADLTNYNLSFGNTELLREPANHFYKYGKYTLAEKGTREYEEYWAIQEDFCRNGYWLGNIWISGLYYFHLNFTQMKAAPDALYLKHHPRTPMTSKIRRFPSIWEIDHLYFLADVLCLQNRENLIPEVNKAVGKTRRAGVSYKEATRGAYNFTFKHGSLTRFIAASEDYLTSSDGIFAKVVDNLTFLNKHTAWSQLRQRGDRTHEKVAQFYDKSGNLSYGHKSKLSAMAVKSPEKVRGGDADAITIEEGGSFPGVIQMLNVLIPQIKDGIRYTGSFTILGTGNNNEQDKYIEGLQTIFYNPSMFDCLSLPNVWEEADNEEGIDALEECGIFIPYYFTLGDFRDKEDVLDMGKAKEYVKKERERREGAVLASYKIEHPIKPSEMFNRSFHSFIPKELKELARQREREVLLDKLNRRNWKVGRFVKSDGKYIFAEGGQGYHEYPVPKGTITSKEESSIEIYQEPFIEHKMDSMTGRVVSAIPDNMYGVTVDPVAKDDAPTSESIFSAHVYRKDLSTTKDKRGYKLIVASFTARWTPRIDMHKQLFLLALLYNAKIQFEVQGGGSELFSDAKLLKNELDLNILQLFETQLNSDIINTGNRSVVFGTNISTVNKSRYTKSFVELLQTPIGYSDYKKRELFVIDTIDNLGLLKEIYKHRDEYNVDRISSGLLIQPQLIQDEIRRQEEAKVEDDAFFNKILFQYD